jgi:hypothetical protein
MIAPPSTQSSSRAESAAERLVLETFARLDKTALGIAAGCVGGLAVFAATVVLLLKGGPRIGPTLALLAQFFPGYSVTWPGSVIGALYGFGAGFVLGWMVALLRNAITSAYLRLIRFRAQFSAVQSVLDDM